jgi:hypothetical protein
MSRTTPRKSRHRHQASGGAGPRVVPASDYESDAAHYFDARDVPPQAQPQHRTNDELNLSVLRRYLPSIRRIESLASNAVVYHFSKAVQSWEKSGIEGTMFVCEQEPAVVSGRVMPRACVFVLNRRTLENLVVDLRRAIVCEITGELIALSLEEADDTDALDGHGDAGSGADTSVIGLWIHAETRERNMEAIMKYWRECSLVSAQSASEAELDEVDEADGAGQTGDTGRRLSITELFGQSNGASRR